MDRLLSVELQFQGRLTGTVQTQTYIHIVCQDWTCTFTLIDEWFPKAWSLVLCLDFLCFDCPKHHLHQRTWVRGIECLDGIQVTW